MSDKNTVRQTGAGMNGKNKRKNKFKIICLCVLILVSGCSRGQRTSSQVMTLPVTKGTITNGVTFIGNVSSSQTSVLNWRTSGVVESVNVSLGDKVKKGDILATLSTDFLPSTVINAEIPLIQAQSTLEALKSSETDKAAAYKDYTDKELALDDAENWQEGLKYPAATTDQIKAAEKDLQGAKDAYDIAEDKYKSVELRDDLDTEKKSDYSALQTALTAYAQALNVYTYYRNNSSENTKEQAAADVKVKQSEYDAALKTFKTYSTYPRERDINDAETAVSDAQDTYNKRSIVADLSGVITAAYARKDDYVTASSEAFEIDNMDNLYIPLDVSEIDVSKVYNGQKATIVLDSDTSKTYTGTVKTVASSGDESSYTVSYETQVQFDDPDDAVKIGMTGEVNVITDSHSDVLLVPLNAITTENEKSYIQIQGSTVASKIEVTVGLSNSYVAEVSSDALLEGDKVIVPSISQQIIQALGINPQDLGPGPNGAMPGGTQQAATQTGNSGQPAGTNQKSSEAGSAVGTMQPGNAAEMSKTPSASSGTQMPDSSKTSGKTSAPTNSQPGVELENQSGTVTSTAAMQPTSSGS